MKNIYQISLLIFGLIFFSIVRAETCDETFMGREFVVVGIYDRYLTCFYYCDRFDHFCPRYDKTGNYVPLDGPWFGGSGCRGSAKDCRFQRVSK